jgi:hypothetical protein
VAAVVEKRRLGLALRTKLRVSRTLSSIGVGRDWFLSRRAAARHRARFPEIERFVLFVGYPRSGHSLVGSLLNAHPDIVISHQLNVMRYLRQGFSRDQLYGLIFLADSRFAEKGRTGTKREYDYAVPGQWQGRYRTLRVIGDKRGRTTTDEINADPALLSRLHEMVGVPISIVHVVRNPYDNITTMTKRSRSKLARTVKRYFGLADGVTAIRSMVPDSAWHEMRHEDLMASPRPTLEALCRFLEVEPAPDYIDACAGVIYDNPHRSRFDIEWSDELVDDVARRIEAYPFLRGYRYDEEPAGRS